MSTTLVPLAGNFMTSADGVLMPIFIKDPDDVLDYGFGWSNHLAGWFNGIAQTGHDFIVAVTFDTGNSALTVLSSNFDDSNTYCWLSGGVPDVTYLVVMHITTDRGRQHDRTFGISVGQN